MKPGYKTSEFWLTIAAALVNILGPAGANGTVQVCANAALGAAYAISRGMAKLRGGNPA
jgi:hypothetical protein